MASHIVPLVERDDIDYANLQKEKWQGREEASQQSFFELMTEAKALAQRLITNFDQGDFAELTQEKPFG